MTAPKLLTPGPTPIPPAVQEAMAQTLPHHRMPVFVEAYGRVVEKLGRVYRTAGDVLVFTASGTGAFESVFANTVLPGDRVLCVSAGAFGERWIAMAEAYGAEVVPLRFAPGERPDPRQVAAAMLDPTLALAVVVHSETSAGTVADVQQIAELSRGRTCLFAVDAVSSLGALPIETDAWGLDVVIAGSQKALMCPPGLAFASVSEAAWARADVVSTPRFYFDWRRTQAAQREGGSAFTCAIPVVLGLDVSLDLVLAEGLEAIESRVQATAGRFRTRVRGHGLGLLSPDDPSCSLVTAIAVPFGVDGEAVRVRVRGHGYVIEGGRGQTAGKVWRFGHVGYVAEADLMDGLEVLVRELA